MTPPLTDGARWIDCILFNGESIALLRLQYLFDTVDKFYICEARHTYQGARKETLYIDQHKDWFQPYLSKIVFHVFEDPFTELWDYEKRHRDSPAEKILRDESHPFVVSGCDVDEIPDLGKLPSKDILYFACERNGGAINMVQEMYYYNFNWRMRDLWVAPFFLTSAELERTRSFSTYRFHNSNRKQIFNCGWHFSYFQTVAEIRRKLESFSHSEYNTEQFKAEEHILHCITNGKDLFLRNMPFVREDLGKFPPEFLEFGCKWLPGFSG